MLIFDLVGSPFHFLSSETFKKSNVNPAFSFIIIEELPVDLAACLEISIASDQNGAGIAGLDTGVQNHAPDAVGIYAVISSRDFLEHLGLTFDIRGRAVSFCNIKRDVTACQRLKNHWCELGEPQTPFDKANGLTKANGNIFNACAVVHNILKRFGFISRIEFYALEILGQTDFPDFMRFAVFDQTCDRLGLLNRFVLGKCLQLVETAATCRDLKFAARNRVDDQILQQSSRSNIRLQPCIGCRISPLADIFLGFNEFVEWNRFEHF